MAFEIPFIWQIAIDIVIGAILGAVFEQIQRAILVAGMAGFVLTIAFVGIGDPNSLQHLTISEANERITFIVTSAVYFMLHLLFVEVGSIPSNLITSRFR